MTILGDWLYRLALWLLPARLRRTWGREMRLAFRDRQEAYRVRHGTAALPLLWMRELGGLVRSAVSARLPGRWARSTAPASPGAWDGEEDRTQSRGAGAPLRTGMTMDQVVADVRFAFRTFTRKAGMMGLAAVSLALGIGASTAMFSVVDSVLLRPLPYDEPEELVRIYAANPDLAGHPTMGGAADRGVFSPPELWWLIENQTTMEAMGGWYSWGGVTLSGDGSPERLDRVLASPGILPALGVDAVRGRLFAAEDEGEGVRSVMLTEAFWTTRFGRDPGVVGSSIRLDDEPFTVVGVLPDRVSVMTGRADVWMLFTGSSASGNWGNHSVSGVVGRLRDGVTPEQAKVELERLLAEPPGDGHSGHQASVFPALEDATRGVRSTLLVLIAAAFVLLAVGCGNVAAILIGAGIDREQEISVRAALGAGRARLVRQLMTESLLLAGIGALGGILLASLITRGLLFLAPPDVPRIVEAAVDGRVLAFALVTAVAAGVLFGMVPALGLSRPDLARSITSSRGTTMGRGRLQGAVVVGELALATVLLVSAALLGRTLFALNSVDLGLRSEGLYAVRMAPPWQRLQDEDPEAQAAAVDGYFQAIVDAVQGVPGVAGVAVTTNVPLTGDRANNDVRPEGWDPEVEEENLIAERRFVSENYFDVTGMRLVEGRTFEGADNRSDAAAVMILSEGLARRVWPDEPAVGRQVAFWGRDPATVVGVVADLRDESLERTTTYAFYVPARQVGPQTGSLMIRVAGDPERVLPAVRDAIWNADADVPITMVSSMEELVSEAVSAQRYRARLMIVFGLLASVFAMMGVYGVVGRSVARRTREMGIRAALGARRHDLRSLVLLQGVRLAVYGAVLGLVGAWLSTRFLADLLYGVEAMDPWTLLAIALVVGAASLAASMPPSRRAVRVDPSEALRAE